MNTEERWESGAQLAPAPILPCDDILRIYISHGLRDSHILERDLS